MYIVLSIDILPGSCRYKAEVRRAATTDVPRPPWAMTKVLARICKQRLRVAPRHLTSGPRGGSGRSWAPVVVLRGWGLALEPGPVTCGETGQLTISARSIDITATHFDWRGAPCSWFFHKTNANFLIPSFLHGSSKVVSHGSFVAI